MSNWFLKTQPIYYSPKPTHLTTLQNTYHIPYCNRTLIFIALPLRLRRPIEDTIDKPPATAQAAIIGVQCSRITSEDGGDKIRKGPAIH